MEECSSPRNTRQRNAAETPARRCCIFAPLLSSRLFTQQRFTAFAARYFRLGLLWYRFCVFPQKMARRFLLDQIARLWNEDFRFNVRTSICEEGEGERRVI